MPFAKRGSGKRHSPGRDGGGVAQNRSRNRERENTGGAGNEGGGAGGRLLDFADGQIQVHPAGYGFVARDDGKEDAFVPAQARGTALDGDRVRIALVWGPRGIEGRVTEVLSRGRNRLTGVLRIVGRATMLEADDPRIGRPVVIEGGTGGGRDGQTVLAEITLYPATPDGPLQARVLRVLGEPEDPRTEMAKTIVMANLPDEFPAAVVHEASTVPSSLREQDVEGRTDLREIPFLTIDPPDARDHDDAVAVQGSRLWVAIADVSHYVRPDSEIDREALSRGNSVYLPNRAIPMLPEALSSGVCSLIADDRLAMVVRIDFDEQGKPVGAAFRRAVVRPRALLTYDDVARGKTGEHAAHIEAMRALAAKLKAQRATRGSLDFDLPEAKVILDQDDPLRVRDVIKQRSTPELRAAYNLIEEFMLAANEAVARYFATHKLPTIWRVHAEPEEKRIMAFAEQAAALGESFTVRKVTPGAMRAFLERIKGHPGERALSMLLLRALAQAEYDTTNVGHFGLAAPHYVHFTSPIRRYPDLMVHRLLAQAHGWETDKKYARADLQATAGECSRAERRAMEVEREIVDLFRAYLMRGHIGDEYDSTVTGVGGPGLFVQIDQPFVDGLVRIDTLRDDFYEVDERRMLLRGRRTGKIFALGETIRVRCEGASIVRRKVDFVPAWAMDVSDERGGQRGRRDGQRQNGGGRKGGGGGGGARRGGSGAGGRSRSGGGGRGRGR